MDEPLSFLTLASEDDLAQALERGEVIHYPVCPFPLPEGPDRQLLLEQRLASRAHKNISFDPHRGKVSAFHGASADSARRLQEIFATFSATTTRWLAGILPRYATGWQLDRVSYRPEEEAARRCA